MKFSGFFAALMTLLRTYWLPFLLCLVGIVVFASAPFLFVYRKAREIVPGGSAVLPAK